MTAFIIPVYAAGLIAVAALYLGRVRMPRPPIGVYRGSDIVIMSVAVVVTPMLYLELPRAVVATIFGLVLCAAIQLTLAPLMSGRLATLIAVALCGVTAAAALTGQVVAARWLTNAVLTIGLVGVANLWTQSGMRASHVAAFAALLTAYDLVATALTDVMARFAAEVVDLPFAPMFAVDRGAFIGLGDLLMLVLYPLVATKSFGRAAGTAATVTGVAVSATISALFAAGVLTAAVPLLTILGPLIVVQYLVCSRRTPERTTAQWRAAPSSLIKEK